MTTPSKTCTIQWVNKTQRGTLKMQAHFDVTNPADCALAEKQLELLHAADINYKITGALFQGHGFGVAAVALMEADTGHPANL